MWRTHDLHYESDKCDLNRFKAVALIPMTLSNGSNAVLRSNRTSTEMGPLSEAIKSFESLRKATSRLWCTPNWDLNFSNKSLFSQWPAACLKTSFFKYFGDKRKVRYYSVIGENQDRESWCSQDVILARKRRCNIRSVHTGKFLCLTTAKKLEHHVKCKYKQNAMIC